MKLPAKVVALWLVLAVVAVGNGLLRESFLLPALGAKAGLAASGVLLAVAILGVCWLALPWFGRLSAAGCWSIGGTWLVMTLLFEFGFGRLVAHRSWPELLGAYDVTTGNLWIIVLIATLWGTSINSARAALGTVFSAGQARRVKCSWAT